MASTKRRYCKEEFAQRGDAIYENDVRPRLKAGDDGKIAAIDIESGIYEMDADELTAGDRLRARLPDAQIWMVRVGSHCVHRFGFVSVALMHLLRARAKVTWPANSNDDMAMRSEP